MQNTLLYPFETKFHRQMEPNGTSIAKKYIRRTYGQDSGVDPLL